MHNCLDLQSTSRFRNTRENVTSVQTVQSVRSNRSLDKPAIIHTSTLSKNKYLTTALSMCSYFLEKRGGEEEEGRRIEKENALLKYYFSGGHVILQCFVKYIKIIKYILQ